MEYHNLEFIVDKNRDSDELDYIREKLFKCLLNIDDIQIKKNVNFFNNTILLNFINRNDIIKLEDKEKKLFLKYLDMFHKNDFFITCEKETINYLLTILDNNEISILENIFMYYKGNSLTTWKKNKLNQIEEILKSGVCYYPDEKEITSTLNVKNLKQIKLREDTNVYQILDGKIKTDYYLVKSKLDKKNVSRMLKSKLPYFEYDSTNIQAKYHLIASLKKIGEKENLPSYNLKNIIRSLHNNNFFPAESYNVYLKIISHPAIKNFQFKKFKNLEKSIAYNIMLSGENIHGILIKQGIFYCICYQKSKPIDKTFSIEEGKSKILEKFTPTQIKKYGLDEKDLVYLTNICKNKKGDILLPDNNNLFSDEGNLIPINFMSNKNLYHYNIFNDLLETSKNNISFDRKNLVIDVDIEIELFEKIDYHYSLSIKNSTIDVLLERDIFIDGEIKSIENYIKKIWKKGYFMSKYGIYRYSTTGIIKNSDIKFPNWFKSTDTESYNWLVDTLKELISDDGQKEEIIIEDSVSVETINKPKKNSIMKLSPYFSTKKLLQKLPIKRNMYTDNIPI